MYLSLKWLTLLLNKGMKIAVPKGSGNYQKYKETIPSLTLMPPLAQRHQTQCWVPRLPWAQEWSKGFFWVSNVPHVGRQELN